MTPRNQFVMFVSVEFFKQCAKKKNQQKTKQKNSLIKLNLIKCQVLSSLCYKYMNFLLRRDTPLLS